MIEQVVELRPELQQSPFTHAKALIQRKIELVQVGPVQRIPRQISERTRLRQCEGRGVDELQSVPRIWIHAGRHVRTPHIPAVAAARSVDDGGCVDHAVRYHRVRTQLTRAVDPVYNVWTGDVDFDRHSGAPVVYTP